MGDLITFGMWGLAFALVGVLLAVSWRDDVDHDQPPRRPHLRRHNRP